MNYSATVLMTVSFCVLATACGTTVISSNPRQVIVESQSLDAKEAQRLADAECGKHKRYARLAIKGDYWERNYTFDCME